MQKNKEREGPRVIGHRGSHHLKYVGEAPQPRGVVFEEVVHAPGVGEALRLEGLTAHLHHAFESHRHWEAWVRERGRGGVCGACAGEEEDRPRGWSSGGLERKHGSRE